MLSFVNMTANFPVLQWPALAAVGIPLQMSPWTRNAPLDISFFQTDSYGSE